MSRLLEWVIKTGIYSGRGLVKSTLSDNIIIWYYMRFPKNVGLIWTKPTGQTYIGDKYIGLLPIHSSFNKVTHRVILEYFSNKIGVGSFDVYDYLEHYMNARGRIIKDVIYVYDEETSKSVNQALRDVNFFIPEGWWA